MFTTSGGATGVHYTNYLRDSEDTGEWNCTCTGFSVYGRCRHVKAGMVLKRQYDLALTEIKQGEKTNWKTN